MYGNVRIQQMTQQLRLFHSNQHHVTFLHYVLFTLYFCGLL